MAMTGDGVNDAPHLGRPTQALPSPVLPTRLGQQPISCFYPQGFQ